MNYFFGYQLHEIERPKTAAEQREVEARRGRAAASLSGLVARPLRMLRSLRARRPIRVVTGGLRRCDESVPTTAR